MIQEMSFHGKVNDRVEFYTTVAGHGLMHRHFYDSSEDGGDRFFYAGNEFLIKPDGIRHKGNGGSFCKYMFGVDQPLKDLIRKDVRNRLAMYGVQFEESKGIVFTGKTDGTIDYERVFRDGNAVTNYYFFLSVDIKGDISQKQENILKFVGKTLKYTSAMSRDDDNALIAELSADLDGYNPVLFIFKLVEVYNKRYYELFNELYSDGREINEDDERVLKSLAEEFGIDQYQQERIKIDVIYNHAENKRVVDEYKDILISFEGLEEIDQKDIASLNRLRALAIKNNIPHFLFDLLDEVLLKDKTLLQEDEPEYIKESRMLLEGLFMMEGGLDAVMSKEDIVKLLRNKKFAMDNRDQSFDGLLLDAGRICDENFNKGDDMALERFSELITYFDRFDTTSSMINHIAFMEEDVSVEKLRSLTGNKEAFESIEKGVYDKFFIRDLLRDKYLTSAGRRKINALKKGLEDVEAGYSSLNDLKQDISRLNIEEKMFQILYRTTKDRLKEIPGFMEVRDRQDDFLKEVLKSLLKNSPVNKIPKNVMKKLFTTLKMEIFYINDVLPKIIQSGNLTDREDFIVNSGFDRFFIEDVERLFLERSGLPEETVNWFKELIEVEAVAESEMEAL
ncbi:MAG: TIGR04442 family protein [Deltaproteobacteria bacterium]|nr:TIGR04442 family protein [Deltaproteobacteria bacterium]